MKRLMTFAKNTHAAKAQQELDRHGIRSRMVVDPLESIHPALTSYRDVVLLISDEASIDTAKRLVKIEKKAG